MGPEVGLGYLLYVPAEGAMEKKRGLWAVVYLEALAEGIHFSSTLLDWQYGVVPIRRNVVGCVVDLLRVLRLKPPHRQILIAAYRGRDRAAQRLTSNSGSRI